MDAKGIRLPVGQVDTYIEGRDLTTADVNRDVIVNWKNMDVAGNIYNSSTNLDFVFKPFEGEGPDFCMYVVDPFSEAPAGGPGGHGGPGGPGGPDGPRMLDNDADANPDMEFFMDETKFYGPRNIGITLENVRINGIISSATQAYKEGLEVINRYNLTELGNITQTAAPAINNGVVLSLDKDSEWTVAGTSYINSLTLAEGAVVKAPAGKKLSVTVDGKAVELAAGEYKGAIVLEIA
jgi:hypothetical protein